jgi:hypothetical protein
MRRDLGRDPTLKERTAADIDVYERRGVIGPDEAGALRRELTGLNSKGQVEDFRDDLIDQHDRNVLSAWTADVRTVVSFTRENLRLFTLENEADGLGDAGLYRPATVSRLRDRLEYGRRYLAFERELSRRKDELGSSGLAGSEAGVEWSAYRAWEDSQDTDVRIDGKRFPSFVKMYWARLGEHERERHVEGLVEKPWAFLSSFDKKLLGVEPKAGVADAWAEFNANVYEGLDALEPGARVKDLAKLKRRYAKELNRRHPGFYTDYLISVAPTFRRLQMLRPIKDSPYAAEWSALFRDAKTAHQAKQIDGVSDSTINDYWADYIRGPARKIIQSIPGFWDEVVRFGGDRLLLDLPN